MNAIAMPPSRSLTAQQQAFVAELVASACTPTEAARTAGFASPGQEAYRLMRKPHVMAAIREERDRVISGSLCNVAVKVLAEIMVDTTLPASARVAACRVAVDMGGHFTRGAGSDDDKPIHEMTNAQLGAFIDRAQAVIDAGGEAPVIEVIAERRH